MLYQPVIERGVGYNINADATAVRLNFRAHQIMNIKRFVVDRHNTTKYYVLDQIILAL